MATAFKRINVTVRQGRRIFFKRLGAFMAIAALLAMPLPVKAQSKDTIKIGVLHSLSGTMAISETVLKDVALMAIEEINAKGGVLGKKLEAVVVDPASNWPLFAEKARQLIAQDKVAVVFGCWTSVSRKSGSAGFRGIERLAVLSGAIRRRGAFEKCFLYRRRAKSTGDSGGGVFDVRRTAAARNASCCSARIMCTRAPPTKSCGLS